MNKWEAYHKKTKLSFLLRQQKGGMSQGLKGPKVPERSAPQSKFRHSKGRRDGRMAVENTLMS